MAERLTNKNHEAINKCGEFSSCYSCRKEICYITEVCEKLGKLEDILEKYGIKSVENLDSILEKYFSDTWITVTPKIVENWALISDIMASDELNRNFELGITKDRDTWKRACELACDVLRDINYKIYNEDRIDFENTFYQQAKKEGEQK